MIDNTTKVLKLRSEQYSLSNQEIMDRIIHRGTERSHSEPKVNKKLSTKNSVISILVIILLTALAFIVIQQVNKVNGQLDKAQSESVIRSNNGSEAIDNSSLTLIANNSSLEVSGYVVARNKIALSSDIAGKIKALFVEIGQTVEQGSIIAELDSRDAILQLNNARTLLKQSLLTQKEAKVSRDISQRRLSRNKELANNNLLSISVFEQSEEDYIIANNRWELAKLENENAENTVKQAKLYLEKHTIMAPFNGVVVDVTARPGEIVSPVSSGSTYIRTGIALLLDPSDLYVEVEIPEKYLSKAKSGNRVELELSYDKNSKIISKVEWIKPMSSRQRGVVLAGISLPFNNKYFDGMEVNIKLLNE